MKKFLILSLVVCYALGCTASEPAPTATPLPPPPTSNSVPTATPVPPTPTALPRNVKNVEYVDGQRLDVYRPEAGNGPFPTVLVFHGYGGTKGNYTWLGEALAAAGYAVVIPNWSPLSQGAEHGLCSLGWLQANAEAYGLDPQRVAVFGHSAGGHVAALAGSIDAPGEFLQDCPFDPVASTALKGVITYGGAFATQEWYLTAGKHHFDAAMEVLEISQDEGEQIRQALIDTPPDKWLEIEGFGSAGTRLIRTTALAWVDGSEPPFLLIHGSEDATVAPLESEAFAEYLAAAGATAQVKLIPEADHDLRTRMAGYDQFMDATLAFLNQVLE